MYKTDMNVEFSNFLQLNSFSKFSNFREDPPKLTRGNHNEQEGKIQTNHPYR